MRREIKSIFVGSLLFVALKISITFLLLFLLINTDSLVALYTHLIGTVLLPLIITGMFVGNFLKKFPLKTIFFNTMFVGAIGGTLTLSLQTELGNVEHYLLLAFLVLGGALVSGFSGYIFSLTRKTPNKENQMEA